jgi:thiamine biosynthesis lipoprotein
MTQNPQNFEISIPKPGSIIGAHRFRHDAMAAVFEIIICYDNPEYARQAAYAAFDELDRIEQQLSRFVENSDISQISDLAPNELAILGPEAFHCLQLSLDMYAQTRGAFDVSVGALYDCWLDGDKNLRTPSQQDLDFARQHTGSDHITLDEFAHTVKVDIGPLLIDLGGIGKGYAVDRMAALLSEWGIDIAFIHGGCSSVLAVGTPDGTNGWPVTLSHPNDRRRTLDRIELSDRALGSSGLQKGCHIIDPRTAKPVDAKLAAWSCAPDAAAADALSTAFMVMSQQQVDQYCREHPDIMAMVIPQNEKADVRNENILRFGPWEMFGHSE